MASLSHITVEIAQEYPDQVLWIKNTTFGEQARKGMDKKRRGEEREVFLKCVCAILNSGGGVLCAKIANNGYNYSEDGIGKDLEDGLINLLDSARIEDFLQITQQDNDLRFFVRSWYSGEGRARICSLNSGLLERSGTSALSISPSAVMDFLKRREREQEVSLVPCAKKQKLMPGYDDIFNKASQFYNEEKAHIHQILDFGESVNVDFKSFINEKNLITRLRETLPKYLSAFANTRGGFLFIGIDDKTKKVVGCGQGLNSSELQEKTQAICDKAMERAIHMHNCNSQKKFSPEIKVFAVRRENESHKIMPYIVAIKIPQFCCAMFEEDPRSWEIEGGMVSQIKCNDWLKRMQFPISDDLVEKFESVLNLQDSPPQCQPVYSIQKITELQERIFPVTDNFNSVPKSICHELSEVYPEVHNTFTNLKKGRGILIMSRSWAVDINQARNEAVIGEALLIRPGEYPRFFSIVQSTSPELWKYAKETAFHLKQKLVNIGGYTGRICVIPHLVNCRTGELIQNESDNTPLYPKSYTLGRIKELKVLLRSLAIVVLSFTSPLSDKLGSEFLNLLTEEQFNILQLYSGIKDLFVHGLPGTGKTLLAMEKIRQIRNMHQCSSENILFLCENVGLKAFIRKRNLCICETRSGFMMKDISAFSKIKHIVVDEGQNFRGEDGDWYGKARALTQREGGVLWIFLDYFQKCHTFKDGLPPLHNQSTVSLDKIVRNSKKVFDVMKKQIAIIARASRGYLSQHLQSMTERMTQAHSIRGEFRVINMHRQSCGRSEVIKCVEDLLNNGHSARDIAVLFSTQADPALCSLSCADLPFPHGGVENVECDFVVLDTIRRFSGLERDVVIVVDPTVHPNQSKIEPNLLLSAYSRARIRLYLIKQRSVWF